MAVLSDAERAFVSALFQSTICSRREAFGTLTKAEVRAAINGLDDYMNTNAAAINSAIPQPARAQLTVPQKAELLKFVITRRYEQGS